MKEKVSIIVPIYKVEKYIEKCIKCLIDQTYENLEIILIDDGSPDKSGTIADKYSRLDSRITVIHQKNAGLSAARNTGLNICSGQYIMFVDSDDLITTNFVERTLELIYLNNADIVICDHSFFNENGKEWKTKYKKENVISNNIKACETILYQKKYDVSAWGKIFKKEVFENLYFPEGLNYEDIPTIYKALYRASSVVFTTEKLYKYQIRKNSIENEPFNPKKLDGIKTGTMMINDIEKEYPELIDAAKSRFMAINFHILSQMDKNNVEKEKIKNNIKKYRKDVLKDKKVKLKVKIACIISFISFELSVGLLKLKNKL